MVKTIIEKEFGIETDGMEAIDMDDRGIMLVDDNNVITLGTIRTRDFDAEALSLVVQEAEAIWHMFHRHVIVCLLMNPNRAVLVKEMNIKSEADFTIKLAHQGVSNPVLSVIRDKIRNGIVDQEDKDFLEVLPMLVRDEDRQAIRAECFELLSMM